MSGDRVVHRSLVQTKYPSRAAGDGQAFSIGQGETYAPFGDAAESERGNGEYSTTLRTILNRLRYYQVKGVSISCEQENVASIRGMLKTGFRYEKSAIIMSML
jgi:hypothetical protein